MKIQRKFRYLLQYSQNMSFDAFQNLVLHNFDGMAPIEDKCIRGNKYQLLNKYIYKIYNGYNKMNKQNSKGSHYDEQFDF